MQRHSGSPCAAARQPAFDLRRHRHVRGLARHAALRISAAATGILTKRGAVPMRLWLRFDRSLPNAIVCKRVTSQDRERAAARGCAGPGPGPGCNPRRRHTAFRLEGRAVPGQAACARQQPLARLSRRCLLCADRNLSGAAVGLGNLRTGVRSGPADEPVGLPSGSTPARGDVFAGRTDPRPFPGGPLSFGLRRRRRRVAHVVGSIARSQNPDERLERCVRGTGEAFAAGATRSGLAVDAGRHRRGVLHRLGAGRPSGAQPVVAVEPGLAPIDLLRSLAGGRGVVLALAARVLSIRAEPHRGSMVLGQLGWVGRDRLVAVRVGHPRLGTSPARRDITKRTDR